MTPAERGQAYSPSTMVGGDLAPFIKAYVDQSKAAYAALDVQTLSYGPHPAQTIDLAVPRADGPVPLHVFIHGGYWQQLSKKESFFAAPETLAQGMGFAAIDYTLAPHATLDEIVAEVVAALRLLRAEASRLRIDPARIVVSGSSAGAQLAAISAIELGAAEQPAGLILLSGIYDLRPLIGTYINDPVGLDTASAKRNSATFRGLSGFPPCVIAWGEIETSEFIRQSRVFALMLDEAERDVATLEVAGRNHFDIVHDLTNDSALGAWLPKFAFGDAG